MKKCPQCERSIPDNAQQCIYCGERLETDTTVIQHVKQPVSQPVQQPVKQSVQETSGPVLYKEPPKTQTRTRSQGTNSKMLYGILALVAGLLIGGSIAWIFIHNRENSTISTEVLTDTTDIDSRPVAPQDMQQQGSGGSTAEAPAQEEEVDPGCYIGKVVVTGTDVRLRSTPQINNHNILKSRNGKNLHPNKGEELPCIDIEGDFYYVDFHGTPCYISSQFSRLVE